MKQYKKNYELKNAAKDKLEEKYGGAVLIVFLSGLISGALKLFIRIIADVTTATVYATTDSMGAVTAMSFVFDAILLATSIMMGVMNAGIALYFLNMACGQDFSIRNLFYGFQEDSRKALLISAAVTLTQAVCLWPGQYLLQFFRNTKDLKWLFWGVAIMIVGIAVYVPVSLGISLSFYLMLDFPEKSGKEILLLCWRVMKGHRMRLFRLDLSFLPLMLLCVLSFGIGFLWLIPHMQMTYTYFFLDLMNPKEAAS